MRRPATQIGFHANLRTGLNLKSPTLWSALEVGQAQGYQQTIVALGVRFKVYRLKHE